MRISSRLWRGRRRCSAHRHLQSRQARAFALAFAVSAGSARVRHHPQDRTPLMTTTLAPTTTDLHVTGFTPIPSPAEIARMLPIGAERSALVSRSRDEVRAVMNGTDDRLLVVVGPCSIHDPEAGLEYAGRLVREADRHGDDLLIVMRAYFEK